MRTSMCASASPLVRLGSTAQEDADSKGLGGASSSSESATTNGFVDDISAAIQKPPAPSHSEMEAVCAEHRGGR